MNLPENLLNNLCFFPMYFVSSFNVSVRFIVILVEPLSIIYISKAGKPSVYLCVRELLPKYSID